MHRTQLSVHYTDPLTLSQFQTPHLQNFKIYTSVHGYSRQKSVNCSYTIRRKIHTLLGIHYAYMMHMQITWYCLCYF